MNAKRTLCTVLTWCALLGMVSALEVDQNELKSAGDTDAIVFKNYNGPHSVIDSAAQIRGIGSSLGTAVSEKPDDVSTVGTVSRYSVIHAVDPNEKGKLDADIFIIGPDATVDHITNVRRILAAYLSAAYHYSDTDAATIATFVTVYNAVYRGKMDVYTSKYKNIVTKNLTADKAGMGLSYTEWPGKSQIVIPLSDVHGGLSAVDTSLISDKQVVKSMQGEDDKGVEPRKAMVDIKEREADSAAQTAQTAQKQATDETQKLKTEQAKNVTAQQEAAAAQKDAATAQQQAEEAQAKADANPADKQAQTDAAQKQQTAEEKQTIADQKQQLAADQAAATADQAKKTEQAQNTAAAAQETADKKRAEAQTERTTIAQDQQTLIQEAAKNDTAPTVLGLKSVDNTGELSSIVKLNAQTGAVISESPVTVIRGRTLLDTGASYIAIAGITRGSGAVKLVLIDKTSLEITKESEQTISEYSVLVEDGGSYYCVIQEGKNYFTAKFSASLDLELKSPVAVKGATPLTVTTNGICVTGADGTALLLQTADLNKVTSK